MDCRTARNQIPSYVEGQIDLGRRWLLRRHLMSCPGCYQEYDRLEVVGGLVKELGSMSAPPDLRIRIQSAISRQIRPASWLPWKTRLDNLMRPIAIPATGGLLSAMVLFGLLISNLATSAVQLSPDVPLTYLAKTWVSHPSIETLSPLEVTRDIIVEAFVDGRGTVYDFRVIRLPAHYPQMDTKLRSELANALLAARFEPATSFGRPVPGKVLISFLPLTQVTVRG